MMRGLLLGVAFGALIATPALAQESGREHRGNNASRQVGRDWSGRERPERTPERFEARAERDESRADWRPQRMERREVQAEQREQHVERREARVERADNDGRDWRARAETRNPAGNWTRSNDDQARVRVERHDDARRMVEGRRFDDDGRYAFNDRGRDRDRDRDRRLDRDDRRGDRDGHRLDRDGRRYDRGDWRFNRNHAYYRERHRYGYGYGHNRHYRYVVPSYVWYRYPYRVWHHGYYFPRAYWGHGWDGFLIDDWYYWDLPRPPRGYAWIRYHDDAILVFLATGLIREVLRDYWW